MRAATKLEKPAPALVRGPGRSQRRQFQLMWNANAQSKPVMPVSAFVHWYPFCSPRVVLRPHRNATALVALAFEAGESRCRNPRRDSAAPKAV